MMIIEIIKSAFDRLLVNKLRAFLTMLGIIIGISSVITITTLGNSLKETIKSELYGSGSVSVIQTYWYTDDYRIDGTLFGYDDVQALKHRYSKYIKSIPLSNNCDRFTKRIGGVKYNISCVGVTSGYDDMVEIKVLKGRLINDEDNDNRRYSVVVPQKYVEANYREDEEPIGREIMLNGNTFVIVGVYKFEKPKYFSMYDTDENDEELSFLIPYTTAAEDLSAINSYGISDLMICAKSGENVKALKNELITYLTDELSRRTDSHVTVETYTLEEELEEISKVLDIITIVISIIAGISLIVGGVGVMNIMLVNVIERTKEIGIRKALGAKNDSIRVQFLTESVVICAVGALIGVMLGLLLGVAGGTIISKFVLSSTEAANIHFVIRPNGNAIIISVLFSCLIGLIFGYYPAKKAANMSPIDALRFE